MSLQGCSSRPYSKRSRKEAAEEKSGVIEVLPVGSPKPSAQHPLGHGPCTEDVVNVQNAVLKAAKTGQKVLLKAGGGTPFNFGTFVPKTGNEWLSCGVHLFTGVSVEGEKDSAGNQSTIENGWMVMRGFNLKGSGTVTVKGIHFKDFGAVAIYFEGIAEDVTVEIRDNRGNTIKNVTPTASGGIVLYGKRIDQNNQVFLGPLGSYEFEKPMSWEVAAGHLSVVGICAHNSICAMEKLPEKIGQVTFKGNVIICERDKDALPLGVLGGSGHTFERVEIVDNTVALENGSAGITVKDVGNASVARNILEGDYRAVD